METARLAPRTATVRRETRESRVEIALNLDGSGRGDISTGIGFLDHMLDSLARHARFDLTIRAEGDLHVDQHHTAEDVGITLGQALDTALGERHAIRRFGDAVVLGRLERGVLRRAPAGTGLRLLRLAAAEPRAYSVSEAVALIHAAGGVASLAHPAKLH